MNNLISNCLVAGISLDAQSQACGIRDNALCSIVNASTGNAIGLNNQSNGNYIYHNYAYANNTNYQNVSLVTIPAPGTGARPNVQERQHLIYTPDEVLHDRKSEPNAHDDKTKNKIPRECLA